jgi:hypothetical protein
VRLGPQRPWRVAHDLALQTAVDRVAPLASAPTLCRFEHWADRATAVALNQVLIEQFIASFDAPPEEIVLDFDATDVSVHGRQEWRFFHGYYDHHCFLPLYVFCGEQLLVADLRPSKIDAAKHSWAILALLVRWLRQAWPRVRIVLRADSGFCRPRLLAWCERHGVGYILGLAKNLRLASLAEPWLADAKAGVAETGEKQRRFGEFRYAAKTWSAERRVIARVEHDRLGTNPRYVVTNLVGPPEALYKEIYCARGDMENRIKEQFELFADRTSYHKWWPNQFRLLLAGLAYSLLTAVRRLGLTGTELARAQAGTIRLKLLKIGAVIWRNTGASASACRVPVPTRISLPSSPSASLRGSRSAGAHATGLRRQCAALLAPATLPRHTPSSTRKRRTLRVLAR